MITERRSGRDRSGLLTLRGPSGTVELVHDGDTVSIVAIDGDPHEPLGAHSVDDWRAWARCYLEPQSEAGIAYLYPSAKTAGWSAEIVNGGMPVWHELDMSGGLPHEVVAHHASRALRCRQVILQTVSGEIKRYEPC